MKSKRQTQAVGWERVRAVALTFPGTEQSTSYGTEAFKVRGKLFVRLKEDGESIVVRIEEQDRAMRLQADPQVFYITDHYVPYPWMLVRLSAVADDDLAELLVEAWRLRAPKRLLTEYDRG